jgi:hypothetical protein
MSIWSIRRIACESSKSKARSAQSPTTVANRYPPGRLRARKQGEIGRLQLPLFHGHPLPPTQFEAEARELEGLLKPDAIDAAILIPV